MLTMKETYLKVKIALMDWTMRFLFLVWCFTPAPGFGREVRHEAYIWQRAWTESVQHAVVEHGKAFAGLVALKTEVSWRDGKPQVVRVPVRYEALVRVGRPVGLALRIGPHAAPFAGTNAVLVSDLAREIIADARGAGLSPSELQLDFDCATSKLEGYRVWVEAVRATGRAGAINHYGAALVAGSAGVQRPRASGGWVCASGSLAGATRQFRHALHFVRPNHGQTGRR